MKPKDKANELFQKYESLNSSFDIGKKGALIAVDEILNVIEDEREGFNWKTYYLEVKQEIEEL